MWPHLSISLQPSISVYWHQGHGAKILSNSKYPGSEFFHLGIFLLNLWGIPTTDLIPQLLNSQENCSWASQEAYYTAKVIILFLDLLWQILKFHLSPSLERRRSEECCCSSLRHRHRGLRQQKPGPLALLLWALLRRGQRAGKEEKRDGCNLRPESRKSEGVHWRTGGANPGHGQVPSFALTESATALTAWIGPKFTLPEQMWSISSLCLACSIHSCFYNTSQKHTFQTLSNGFARCLCVSGVCVYMCVCM